MSGKSKGGFICYSQAEAAGFIELIWNLEQTRAL